jgi:hypothetical protein
MARKIFEEKIQAPKKACAEIAGKFIDDLAKDDANELQDIKGKRLKVEKILQEKEEENTIEKLIRIREENAKFMQQIANMENEQKKPHDFKKNQERSKRFLIVRNGPTQNKKRKRRRRNELGRRSIKPNSRRLSEKKYKSSLFQLEARYRD